MHEKLAQGCGIFNSHFDRRLRERNIQDVQSLSVEMATAWVMHTSQLFLYPRCQLQPLLATLRKAMETMGCSAKMLASSNYDYIQPEAGGVCHGFSIRQSWSNTFQVVEMSGKAPPHHPWDARCVARSTTPLRTGFGSFAFNHCIAWVKRGCSKIMVPLMSTDSPEICPRGQGKHVVVFMEHRWPICHQDHLASTEHYNQIQAALHRSEVKTWWRFMNLMNPLLLGTFVHALL